MYIVPSGSPVAALTPATSKVVDDDLEVPKQEEGYDYQYQVLYMYVFVTTLFSHSEFPIHNELPPPGLKDYVSLSQSVVQIINKVFLTQSVSVTVFNPSHLEVNQWCH